MRAFLKTFRAVVAGFILLIGLSGVAYAGIPAGFTEYTVKRGDTWESVIPDEQLRVLARKVNRMNIELTKNKKINVKKIVVPVGTKALLYVPVPTRIASNAKRELVFYKQEQYFGAYEYGELVRWGPISTGRSGNTPVGTYQALYKEAKKRSTRYHNSRMYFAVQFSGNFFSHEQILPGYPASKGCVRMLWEDAEWKFNWIRLGDPIRVVRSADQVV